MQTPTRVVFTGKAPSSRRAIEAEDEIRVVYSQLFNVLALKFTPHGSEHIQSTEIMLMQGRLYPLCLGMSCLF